MKDIKGREVDLGDFVRVTGGSKISMNGWFFVKDGPMDPLWDKDYFLLHRIDRNTGAIIYNYKGHPEQTFPIQEDPDRNKNAQIEVFKGLNRNEVADFILNMSRERHEQALCEAREHGSDSLEYHKAIDSAALYEDIARQLYRAVNQYLYYVDEEDEDDI